MWNLINAKHYQQHADEFQSRISLLLYKNGFIFCSTSNGGHNPNGVVGLFNVITFFTCGPLPISSATDAPNDCPIASIDFRDIFV